MTNHRIDVFFYGLFMDVDLLRGKGLVPINPRRASIDGYGLRIGGRATLVPAKLERSYGVVVELTQVELAALYSGLEQYHPETITCTTLDGDSVSAVCYNLRGAPQPDEANVEYASQLRALLTKLGFPADYVDRVG